MGKKGNTAQATPTGRRTRKKRGFLRKLVLMGALSAAVKFFADEGNRKKAMGLVGK